MNPRLRLILAAAAFLGWIGWLTYASLTKSHAPTVSHAQAAAATTAVVAELNDGSAKATITKNLWGEAPEGSIEVPNLPGARGFTGPGKYLLYLTHQGGTWLVVGQQRSPGNDLSGVGPPLIYPWTDDIARQAEHLKPMK